ncbi:arginase [Penicillium angulare]|uniref:Arginase n=1 Tax=Penicillium angulare TaxID=116970 RepID=A0A9W9K6A5_9EURO|nr:arginase [Penicillium angulare]
MSKFLSEPTHLAVVAARFSCGAPRVGAEQGPQALVDWGVFSDIQARTGYLCSFDSLSEKDTSRNSIESSQNLDANIYEMKKPHAVSLAAKRVSDCVYSHAREGRFVMTLGGDHSIGVGTVTGTARAVRERFDGADLSVLWIDAHADINTPQSSMSGRIHGMPVAFASGLAKSPSKGIFNWITKSHLINLKKFVYIGLRDVDKAEEAIIHQYGIKSFTMGDIRSDGIERIMDLALQYLGDDSPIHVSYDVDSLDPEYAPSTGFPIPGGLSLEEGIYISQRLYATKGLVAMDLVEVNPLIESSRLTTTLQSAASVMKAALGVGYEV